MMMHILPLLLLAFYNEFVVVLSFITPTTTNPSSQTTCYNPRISKRHRLPQVQSRQQEKGKIRWSPQEGRRGKGTVLFLNFSSSWLLPFKKKNKRQKKDDATIQQKSSVDISTDTSNRISSTDINENIDSDNADDNTDGDNDQLSTVSATFVSGVMDSMENFKKTQEVGKMTTSIVQELSALTIEGVSSDGKVRVYYDGQQRPISVQIDESYFLNIHIKEQDGTLPDTISDLTVALTTAMQDGYEKSSQRMDEKMKAFYKDIGLPPNN